MESESDQFLQRLAYAGHERLVALHGWGAIVLAQHTYCYDLGVTEPLLALLPILDTPEAEALQQSIESGARKPNRRKARRPYHPAQAWNAAWQMICVRRAHKEARGGVEEIADRVAVEPGEARAKVNAVNRLVMEQSRSLLGVSERTMDDLVAEVEKILAELPQNAE